MQSFCQPAQDSLFTKDQNPNYLKSKSKYLKKPVTSFTQSFTSSLTLVDIPLKKSKQDFESALTQAKIQRDTEKIQELSNNLSNLYKKQGNYKDAYEMRILFQNMTDSLNKKETEQAAQQHYFTQQQLLDSITALELQKTYLKNIAGKNKEVQSSKKIIYITSLAFFITTILSFFLYKSYKKTKYSNNIINTQKKETELKKQQIEQALQEKELLLKEVHHRVKNNLQIIASLLNLQANKTDSVDVKKIMSEAKQRINSMALIHQKMYQSGNLSSIDFQGYIEQIAETIALTFNDKQKHITYFINTHNISLTMDTAVPLGLIVNELLTNCYKYAFINTDKGCINITLKQHNNNQLQLYVYDNGIGLAQNFEDSSKKSLGLKLVKGLAEQLKGTLKCHTDNGAHFSINFSTTT